MINYPVLDLLSSLARETAVPTRSPGTGFLLMHLCYISVSAKVHVSAELCFGKDLERAKSSLNHYDEVSIDIFDFNTYPPFR